MDQILSETRPVSPRCDATFVRAQRIEGTIDERIAAEGDAEIRRGGTVLRGDRITYTRPPTRWTSRQTRGVVFGEGGSFSAPQMSFRIDAQTGSMTMRIHLTRSGTAAASGLVEFLSEQRAAHGETHASRPARRRRRVVGAGGVRGRRRPEQSASATGAVLYFQGLPILGVADLRISGRQSAPHRFPDATSASATRSHGHPHAVIWNIRAELRLHRYAEDPQQARHPGRQRIPVARAEFNGNARLRRHPKRPRDRYFASFTSARLTTPGRRPAWLPASLQPVSDDNYFVGLLGARILGSSQKCCRRTPSSRTRSRTGIVGCE